MTNNLRYVGRALIELESEAKLRGGMAFTSDLDFSGMLYAAVLRSPHAHAKIRSIDVSKSRALPGVTAVVTGSDLPGVKYQRRSNRADRYPLARDKVRFLGEEVAAVAAESLETAERAIELIEVDYQVLPFVLNAEAALEKRAPDINQRPRGPFEKNLAQGSEQTYGDVERAFERAAFIIEGTYRSGMVAASLLETQATVAFFDSESGDLLLWTATETPYLVRREVASVLLLDQDRVHLRSIAVGGGAGGRTGVCGEEAIASALAMRCRAPVKLVLPRHAALFGSGSNHAKIIHLKHALDEDGRILARSSSLLIDNGAYTGLGPSYAEFARQRTTSLYLVGAAHCQSKLVYTNKVPAGQYLAAQAVEITWAIEDQVDQAAEKLRKDPLQYRLEQANRPGQVTPLGWEITSCGLTECLEIVGDRIGWQEARWNPKPYRGVGVAAMIQPCAPLFDEQRMASTAVLELRPEGRLTLGTQTADTGTWQNTLLAQLCAEALGLDPSLIDVLHMDTDFAPEDAASSVSNVVLATGSAVVEAGRRFLEELRRRVSAQHGVTPAEVWLEGNRVRLRGARRRRLKLEEVYEDFGPLRIEGRYARSGTVPHAETGYGDVAGASAFGAQAVDLEVDPATGKVKINRIVAAQDVGRLINPCAFRLQVCGSVMRGVGMALSEEVVFDQGRPVTTSLADYKLPRLTESPEIDCIAVESEGQVGPFGVKATGEFAASATVAAIGNAIAHALGIRLSELPFTPERILAAWKRKSGVAAFPTKPWSRPVNLKLSGVRAMHPRILLPMQKRIANRAAASARARGRPEYLVAKSLREALDRLLNSQVPTKICAGGTDLHAGMGQGIYTPDLVVDISRIADLREIVLTNQCLRVGAAASLSSVAGDNHMRSLFPVIARTIEQIASLQIRNMASIGGNLCQQKQCWFYRNTLPCRKRAGPGCPCYAVSGDSRHHSIFGGDSCAAPCPADLAPVLDVLEAALVVRSATAERRCYIADFYRWSGEPRLDPDEMLVAIEIPLPSAGRKSVFEKFALRGGDFAEVSVAASLRVFQDRISYARLCLGAVSPFPERPHVAERVLVAQRPSTELVKAAARATVRGALPTKHNQYKVDLLMALTERALVRALGLAAS